MGEVDGVEKHRVFLFLFLFVVLYPGEEKAALMLNLRSRRGCVPAS
jgi:hypothetical protein